MMENMSEMLRKILVASGWSQERLADKIGVSFPTLNSWVNGKTAPRAAAGEKIRALAAEVLGAESIDAAQLKAVKSEALRQKFSIHKILNNREALELLGVNMAYHSNGTEGSTMSESDVAAVILQSKILRNRSSAEQREAINHQTALYYLLDELQGRGGEPFFTPDMIRSMHLRLMNGLISDAGMWRNHGVRIRGASVALANFIKIPELMQDWCNLANGETRDPIGLLAQTHAQFERIHPFADGNGRAGRLLLFVMALRLGLVPPILPKDRRMAYYKYLALAQTREIYDPLELYIAENIIATARTLEGGEVL